jgi:hypothetical protein
MSTATPSNSTATVQPLGLTLAQYATAKRLPVEFLEQLGLTDGSTKHANQSVPAVRIPYRGVDGRELAARYRLALKGKDRFKWTTGSKTDLYGLDRLADARKGPTGLPTNTTWRPWIIVVEGESDCHTLWHHNQAAVGLPGAATFKPEWAAHFEGIGDIYVIVEADTGGSALLKALAQLPKPFRDRISLVRLKDVKDPSALHLDSGDDFDRRWELALDNAESWAAYEARQREAVASEAWEQCEPLAMQPDILSALDRSLDRCGLAGERRVAKLLYLAVTSRLLDWPVSIVVKGPSSGGKSFVVKEVLKHYPPEVYYELTSMSDHALACGEEDLVHRMLVIYEAEGFSSENASRLIRSLLSESRIRYETVMKTAEGLKGVLIDREGPTGLLTTTTAASLHPENETRMLSLLVTDTKDQTRRVMQSLARQAEAPGESSGLTDEDLKPWHSHQQYLAATPDTVAIPYAPILADLIPPVAVRLRRDLTTLFGLIKSHALLHKATRDRHADGHVMATVMDYAVVRELVGGFLETTVETTVPETTREVVQAVKSLLGDRPSESRWVMAAAVATRLKLDKSATSRRIKGALGKGYLVNNEVRKGRPMQLVMGDPLPEDQTLLPSPEALLKAISDANGISSCELPPGWIRGSGARGCTVADQTEGIERGGPWPGPLSSSPFGMAPSPASPYWSACGPLKREAGSLS